MVRLQLHVLPLSLLCVENAEVLGNTCGYNSWTPQTPKLSRFPYTQYTSKIVYFDIWGFGVMVDTSRHGDTHLTTRATLCFQPTSLTQK